MMPLLKCETCGELYLADDHSPARCGDYCRDHYQEHLLFCCLCYNAILEEFLDKE